MFGIILEIIVSFFVEVIFQGILLRILRGAKLVGLYILKLIILSNKNLYELKEKYKDSSKPYVLGFIVIIGLIYLLKNIVN